MRTTRQSLRGFTLVEVMLVVAILIILTVVVGVTVRPQSRAVDVATRVGNLLEQASRDAIRYGMVRSDVATAQGSKRRTRVRATAATSTAGPTFIAEVLIEDTTPSPWVELGRYTAPVTVTGDGFANVVGTYSSVGTLVTDWTTYVVSCFPSGSCSSSTAFFSTTKGALMDRQARVSSLPIGGSIYVRNAWN